ncbi:MAG: hypothetical protein J2P15_01960 [Micromonosporaceae bacterium]|nr:hypothetical protein [Micromonosporaceae bacterium]
MTTQWTPRESAVVAGVARADITPPVGIRAHNWGAARVGQATGVHRPLTASALAVADDAVGWRYLLTVDLGWWQSFAGYQRVYRPVLAALCPTALPPTAPAAGSDPAVSPAASAAGSASAGGGEPDAVLLHLVHTHAGPTLAEEDSGLPGSELVGAYRERLVQALIEVATVAREAAQQATVTWAYGSCRLAANRDLPLAERDVLGFNPAGSADDTVLVGRITAAGGAPVGVLVNYACHPTTLAHQNTLVSPDYVGAVREVVEQHAGAPCLFLQGASGDLGPREQYAAGTEVADRHGRALGHAVASVLETMGTPGSALHFGGVVESGAPLGIWHEAALAPPSGSSFARLDVPIACRPDPSQSTVDRWADIDPAAAAERRARAGRLAEGYAAGGAARHPVFVWRLGDAVIVAHPGEAYSQLQTELRRRHPERAVAVLNLTNGPGFMYLPPREAYRRDRYQVWQTLAAEGTLEAVTDAADAAIAALPPARPVAS